MLSLTFTLVMAFFCVGSLVAGVLSKKVNPRIYVLISGVLFLAGFMIASMTGESPILLYLGFGILCGLGAGFAYNAVTRVKVSDSCAAVQSGRDAPIDFDMIVHA